MKNSFTKAEVLEMSFIKKANAGYGKVGYKRDGKRFNYDFIGKTGRQRKKKMIPWKKISRIMVPF